MKKTQSVKFKPIEIDINGQTHTMKFDFNAFVALEEKFGSIDEALQVLGMAGKFSAKGFRTFLWASLLHENEDLTEKEVGSWLTLDSIPKMMDDFTAALSSALPEADKAEKNVVRPLEKGTETDGIGTGSTI